MQLVLVFSCGDLGQAACLQPSDGAQELHLTLKAGGKSVGKTPASRPCALHGGLDLGHLCGLSGPELSKQCPDVVWLSVQKPTCL